jgi:hypothetical protein
MGAIVVGIRSLPDWLTYRQSHRIVWVVRPISVHVKLPFLLVVVDVQTLAPEWSILKDLEGEATISTILLDGLELGAGIIFVVPDRKKVPSRFLGTVHPDYVR